VRPWRRTIPEVHLGSTRPERARRRSNATAQDLSTCDQTTPWPPSIALVRDGAFNSRPTSCEAQLEVHVNASLNVGLTPTEIVEAITHTAVYCGFPKALNAIFVAKSVFAERDLLPVSGGPRTG